MRAAALRDLLAMLRRRWPPLRIIVYPAPVQGDGAAHRLAAAIRTANARHEVEVLVVTRGGGSIEDLWAFNEEAVALAVFESALPVVSAVGHETDFTICDFVADVRAPTPTAAATLVVPDRRELARHLDAVGTRWRRAGERVVETPMQRVDALARRLVHPAAKLARQAHESRLFAARLGRALHHRFAVATGAVGAVAHRFAWHARQPFPQAPRLVLAGARLSRAARANVNTAESRTGALAQNLAHLNPQAVLQRGYTIATTADGAIVQDAGVLAIGDSVTLAFARGGAEATISKVRS